MNTRSLAMSPAALLAAFCLSLIPFSSGCGATKAPRPVSEVSDGGRSVSPRPGKADRQAGIYHRLKAGQTLSALARIYQVPVAQLMQVNGINDPTSLRAGTRIFIPGATRAVKGSARSGPTLAWPITGRITTAFNTDAGGGKRHHEGIDIDGEMGQTIRAAAAGTVLEAATDGRYGKCILIDHGAGLMTFYAHASKLLVHPGERVEQGEAIAEVGRSGNARGTHLHFETRRDGCPVNPLVYLGDRTVMATATR